MRAKCFHWLPCLGRSYFSDPSKQMMLYPFHPSGALGQMWQVTASLERSTIQKSIKILEVAWPVLSFSWLTLQACHFGEGGGWLGHCMRASCMCSGTGT